MNYSVLKFKFSTPVHFGPSNSPQNLSESEICIHADTLFSALCHTALQMYGEDYLNEMCEWVKNGEFLLSDTMPWCDDEYYLPKPFIISRSNKELPTEWTKAMKKLAWLPMSSFNEFSDSVKGGEPYNPMDHEESFGMFAKTTKVKVDDGQDSAPYTVGYFSFKENCGLYVVIGYSNDEQLEKIKHLFRSLALSGIGGKISSGYGKFSIEKVVDLENCDESSLKWLYNALSSETQQNMLINASLPKEDELEDAMDGANYQLVRRSGFVFSESFCENPVKKKTQYFLCAGSVIKNRFEGDLYDVGENGNHPVYRYSKPMFLGVDI